jgi:type II secretory pathway pseudopilin PulG
MAFRLQTRRGARPDEGGYVLMILLLTMALMIIFAAAIVPTIEFNIKRDREEEMIHRGVEYSRAVRRYYKKFGRYPASIENLEQTNNLRFLRKRYKDPVTGEDFKLLHIGEVKLVFGGGLIPGATQPGAPGVTNLGGSALNTPLAATGGTGTAGPLTNGSDPSQASSGGTTANASGQDNNGNSNASGGDPGSSNSQNPAQTFGGMPIVGVASTSQKDTIREFNHKHKYNEWQFFYDPGTDRGGLLMTPNQPPLLPPGTSGVGQPGTSHNGFGNSPTGLSNNPNPPANGQPGTSSDPNNPPQQ